MALKENPEQAEKQESLRSLLKKEALAKTLDTVKEDSERYREAAVSVAVFLKRTLEAADLLEEELRKDEALPAGDARKLKQEDRRRFEDFITEAEALAILLPPLLQQARIVQYQPDVQKRLEEVYDILQRRDKLLSWIEETRSALLQGGTRRGRPIRPDELPKLISIADGAWRLREQLTIPADLQKLLDALEKEGEPKYREFTEQAGRYLRTARTVAEVRRRDAGAERITQGLPGAELILDTPETSLAVWQRLLLEGGPREKKRAARQLKEAAQQFQKDFLKQEAYTAFEKFARERMEAHKKKNKSIRWWFELFHMDAAGDIATTPDREFEEVFQKVTGRMKEQFDAVASLPEAESCAALTTLLQQMEQGKDLNEASLEQMKKSLSDYGALQRKTGEIIAAIQRWQVAESIGTNDNPAFGPGNMLEHITRIGDKTFIGYLREHSPYGVFRTRSYTDARTGRLILIAPSPAPQGIGGHAVEIGKIIGVGVPTTVVVHQLLKRIPVLGRAIARIGTPVLLAEATMVGAEAAARTTKMRQAVIATEASLTFLRNNVGRLPREQLIAESNLLFTNLLVLLQSAQTDTDPRTADQVTALEAHLYTNQFLTSLGYPPVHELTPGQFPKQSTDLPKDRLSPELRDYLTVHIADRRERTEQERENLLRLREQVERHVADIRQLQRGGLPDVPLDTAHKRKLRDLMLEATRAKEFGRARSERLARFGEHDVQRTEEVFRSAGEIFQVVMKIDIAAAYARRAGRRILPGETVKDGSVSFTPTQLRQDIRRIMSSWTLQDILAMARHLETHEPSNAHLMQYWSGREYKQRPLVDTILAQRFGTPGNRSGMGGQLLDQWLEAYAEAERLSLLSTDPGMEVNIARLKRSGDRVYALPDDYVLSISAQQEPNAPQRIILSLGQNREKGPAPRFVPGGRIVIADGKGERSISFAPDTPEQSVEDTALTPGSTITIYDGEGKKLLDAVPLVK